MPWNWGRKGTAAPPAPTDGPVADPGLPDFLRPVAPARAPDGGRVRFQVQGVYSITGLGIVVVGELVSGELRPGDVLRLADGPSGSPKPLLVSVHQIEARHRAIAMLRPGTKAGLSIRRVPAQPGQPTGVGRDEVQPGDILVPPRASVVLTAVAGRAAGIRRPTRPYGAPARRPGTPPDRPPTSAASQDL